MLKELKCHGKNFAILEVLPEEFPKFLVGSMKNFDVLEKLLSNEEKQNY